MSKHRHRTNRTFYKCAGSFDHYSVAMESSNDQEDKMVAAINRLQKKIAAFNYMQYAASKKEVKCKCSNDSNDQSVRQLIDLVVGVNPKQFDDVEVELVSIKTGTNYPPKRPTKTSDGAIFVEEAEEIIPTTPRLPDPDPIDDMPKTEDSGSPEEQGDNTPVDLGSGRWSICLNAIGYIIINKIVNVSVNTVYVKGMDVVAVDYVSSEYKVIYELYIPYKYSILTMTPNGQHSLYNGTVPIDQSRFGSYDEIPVVENQTSDYVKHIQSSHMLNFNVAVKAMINKLRKIWEFSYGDLIDGWIVNSCDVKEYNSELITEITNKVREVTEKSPTQSQNKKPSCIGDCDMFGGVGGQCGEVRHLWETSYPSCDFDDMTCTIDCHNSGPSPDSLGDSPVLPSFDDDGYDGSDQMIGPPSDDEFDDEDGSDYSAFGTSTGTPTNPDGIKDNTTPSDSGGKADSGSSGMPNFNFDTNTVKYTAVWYKYNWGYNSQTDTGSTGFMDWDKIPSGSRVSYWLENGERINLVKD